MSTRVGESTGYGPNFQMSAFGYIMAAILLILALPLLPVIVPAYLVWRVFFAEDDKHSFESWREDSGRPPSGS